MQSQTPRLSKNRLILTNDHYKNPNTSPLIFHFKPQECETSYARLKRCSIAHCLIEGKDIYAIDDYFLENEGQEIRSFSQRATFSRNSYGSPEAIEKGEKPARSMNGKERWQFFSHPPQPIQEIYNLFGMLSHRIDCEITTLPWELCDQNLNGSPSVIGNFLVEASQESMEWGKHQDCNPEAGLAFGIPVLYSAKESIYPERFVNGDTGRPWIISLMLYATADNYIPQYCMGTSFYEKEGKLVLRTRCHHMRLVVFEGDIFHSIEASQIPPSIQTWRVSYVFKLICNPKRENQNVKNEFSQIIRTVANNIIKFSCDRDQYL